MLNPLKHLIGKLNHLQLPQGQYFRIIQLANSIRIGDGKTLENVTEQDIRALKSENTHLDTRRYHKFQFDYQVHSQSAIYSTPSTIYDDLGPHQRKMTHLVWSYASRLNTRQQLYLNLALRKQINSQFPVWNTLHLTPVSPTKADLEVLPTLAAASRLTQLKSTTKKEVMKHILQAKQG